VERRRRVPRGIDGQGRDRNRGPAVVDRVPRAGEHLDRLLRKAIIPSDDKAANELLIWLGGSISGGAARVNALFRALGMAHTDMYGG
jgi:hypothetical protein